MHLLRFGWSSHPPHTYRDEYRAICLDKVREHLKKLPTHMSQEQRAIEVAKEFDLAYDQSVTICELISRMELATFIDHLRSMDESIERQLAG